MRDASAIARIGMLVTLCVGVGLAVQPRANAHCDTLDGPVVQAARVALEKADVTPVLKWVKPGPAEEEIRSAFKRTLAVRGKGPEARELADMYFFETLVRVHRSGEGAPYTGLKPAGAVEPGIAAADTALSSGAADGLVQAITEDVAAGIRQRFAHAMEKKKHADESVQGGREFVAAYVEFIHYVERLHADALSQAHQERQEEGTHDAH